MPDQTPHKPVVLAIIDGWGVRAERSQNAIALAKTPIYDRVAAESPRTVLMASGEAVGLHPGKPGNAQAGHMTIGAGRPVSQDIHRLQKAMTGNGSDALANLQSMRQMIQRTRSLGGAIHLIGMVTPSGIYGHQTYLAMLAAQLSHEGLEVWIHAITDGMDTRPQAGVECMAEFLEDIAGAENAQLATVTGRHTALDHPSVWTGTQAFHKAIAEAVGTRIEHATPYIASCHDKGMSDADIPPAVMANYRGIRQDDAILLFNLRPDRLRRLMASFVDPEFAGFERPRSFDWSGAYSLFGLGSPLDQWVMPLLPRQTVRGTLSEAIAQAGLTQIEIVEAINEANITEFQCGGRESELEGESLFVADTAPHISFETNPEMAAEQMADEVVRAIKKNSHDLIIVNFPSIALVGNSGNIVAARKAVEHIDKCLGKIVAVLEKSNGCLLITSAYGNAELMADASGNALTENTGAHVPLVFVGNAAMKNAALRTGTLADIAPTILDILDIETPTQMTGRSLLLSADEESRVSA